MPPKKKNNKKEGGKKVASGFEYEALIPDCLSGDDRELVKKFLLNELESSKERDDALAVFAAAVIEDKGSTSEDTGDEELVNELRAVVGGSGSITAAEVKRAVAPKKNVNAKPEGVPSSSSSSTSAAKPTLPASIVATRASPPGSSGAWRAASAPSAAHGATAGARPTSVVTIADHLAHMRVSKDKGKAGKKPPVPVPPVREVECREDWGEDANAHLRVPRTGPVLDTQEKRVSKEVADEIRKNVNVGWWASPFDADEKTDTHIADYAQSLGGELYNFISYPIGGMARSAYRIKNDGYIPPINLPDLQLANPHWETYVAGHPSLWIDCDDVEDDPWQAMLSCLELDKELNYAHYLGLSTVVIELWQKSAPALAGVISKFLWTVQSNLKICIMLPTEAKLMDGDIEDEREIWEIWADFRASIGNFAGDRLCCGIKLMEDLDDEFTNPLMLRRWQAEPLTMFTMETNVFTTNERTGGADLAPAHTKLLETLWTSETMTAAIRGPLKDPRGARLQYAQAIRSIIGPLWLKKKLSKKPNFLDLSEVHYQDVIQKPLQPLADNLQSSVYNTFEADAPKYKYYGEAVEAAIFDMVKKRGKGDIVLYVLGAGRGPLMSASIAAEKRVNEVMESGGPRVRLECVAVEKNENAVVTLNYLNSTLWGGRVRIVEADMRYLKEEATKLGVRRPDIIVSELLGSFGDNELSPECLDGCADWMKEDTISIPQSYTSYCEPVASLSLYNSIKAQPTSHYFKGRQANGRKLAEQMGDGTYTQEYPEGREQAMMDMLYVVYLDKVVRQCIPKPYFTFTHPCPERLQTQTRRDRWRIAQQWSVPCTQDIMGFACYFSARLYKDVTLSIVREQETPDMLSWFPAVLPLRKPLRVKSGEQVCFVVERCRDEGGVWYEWFAMISGPDLKVPPRKTEVQNVNGVSYYMRLISEKEKELQGKARILNLIGRCGIEPKNRYADAVLLKE